MAFNAAVLALVFCSTIVPAFRRVGFSLPFFVFLVFPNLCPYHFSRTSVFFHRLKVSPLSLWLLSCVQVPPPWSFPFSFVAILLSRTPSFLPQVVTPPSFFPAPFFQMLVLAPVTRDSLLFSFFFFSTFLVLPASCHLPSFPFAVPYG